ncbi:MAG: CdaR family protein, partial [Thermodesulfobacteriota bacterium]
MPVKSNYKLKNLDVINPFFKNFGKKIIAVIIAILLWIVANLEFDIEKSFYVPVNYSNLSERLIVTNNPPQEVSFKVKGPRSELSTLTSSNSLITIDLAGFSNGVSNIQVQTDIMNLPREIDVISVSPSEISLDIDKLITKDVKIHPILDPPDKGYVIEDEPK